MRSRDEMARPVPEPGRVLVLGVHDGLERSSPSGRLEVLGEAPGPDEGRDGGARGRSRARGKPRSNGTTFRFPSVEALSEGEAVAGEHGMERVGQGGHDTARKARSTMPSA